MLHCFKQRPAWRQAVSMVLLVMMTSLSLLLPSFFFLTTSARCRRQMPRCRVAASSLALNAIGVSRCLAGRNVGICGLASQPRLCSVAFVQAKSTPTSARRLPCTGVTSNLRQEQGGEERSRRRCAPSERRTGEERRGKLPARRGRRGRC